MPRHFVVRPACPGCAATDAKTLVDLPFDAGPVRRFVGDYYERATDLDRWLEGGRYRVDRCDRCGLIFQREVADGALLEALYDTWLSGGGAPDNAELREPARSRDGHELFTVAAALGRSVRDLRVLDYGMGWGGWAIGAVRLGARVYGYDLAESRRQHAKAHGVTVVGLDELTALGMDFVNTEQVFEHLTDPRATLRVLAAALRPGGVLKISVPLAHRLPERLARFDWQVRHGADINAMHPLEHINAFDQGALAAFATGEGLAPMRIPTRAYLAFTRRAAAIPTRPLALAKAFARPLYHRFSRRNLYAWFRRG